MKLKLIFATLFFVSLKHNALGIAPVETIEVFLGQNFRSEVCEAESTTLWRINDTNLTDVTTIESFNGRVERGSNDATGDPQATLILKRVNLTLNGCVLSCTCSSCSTQILTYKLVVVNTTIKWLAPNETFSPPVCISPLVESLPPYWMINGIPLTNTTLNNMYGAQVNRLGDDKRGRHQAELIISSVNETLDKSNISCAVGTELRKVYILFVTGPEPEETVTPERTVHAMDKVHVVAETSEPLAAETSNKTVGDAVIAGSVSTGVVILALLVFIAVSLCVFLISKRNRKYKKTGHEVERVYPDAVEDDEHDVETDRVKRTPVHTSDEQERLLRQRTTVLRDAKK